LLNLAVGTCLKKHARTYIEILFCKVSSGWTTRNHGAEVNVGAGDKNREANMNCDYDYDYYYY